MPCMPLILNEWVIHDLIGDNSEERQTETLQFLKQIEVRCDFLVLLYGSPWMKKAYKLMKEPRVGLRSVSKFLQDTFLFNSSKCKVFYTNEVPSLSSKLQSVVPAKDSYLLALHTAVPESIIITTDEKLVEALSGLPSVRVSLRDDFLRGYM